MKKIKYSLTVMTIILLVLFAATPASSQTIQLDIKVFLEGPYFSNEMAPFLNVFGYLPELQPYNVPPWNYEGPETVTAIPNSDVIDWVLLELRQTSCTAETADQDSIIAQKAVFLLREGHLADLDGTTLVHVDVIVSSDLYAVIWHRNHLGVMSAFPLTLSNGIYIYDFTDDVSKVFGAGLGHKQVDPGVWAMTGGDGNADGQIGNADKIEVWRAQAGQTGYLMGDFDMNGQVDNSDKIEIWIGNVGRSTQVPQATYTIWSCGKPFVDVRDGQAYETVEIGDQCWMAENLNIGHIIPGINNQTDNDTIEKYCWGDTAAYCDAYGGLYQWEEMMAYATQQGAQGICPSGWCVPSDEEWKELEGYADSYFNYPDPEWDKTGYRGFDAGRNLKSTTGWSFGGNGTDLYGFKALPGGNRSAGGAFYNVTYMGFFWTSTAEGTSAWDRFLDYFEDYSWRGYISRQWGFSVRCLMDENQPPAQPSNPDPPDNAANQPLNIHLSWSCNDPEGDTLTYDAFFGSVHPPPQVISGQADTTFHPGLLEYSTQYFWKIIAHDDHGHLTEGPVWSFFTADQPAWQCGQPFTDPRDNKTYATVQIGNQCWMAGNMNTGIMIPGTVNATDNGIIEKQCYGDDPANCDEYGGLYMWDEMMGYSTTPGAGGICPPYWDWHIPGDAEWCTLEHLVDSNIICNMPGWRGVDGGGKLKETGSTHWAPPNTGATNTSGFTALPTGHRYSGSGMFFYLPEYGFYWTSSESGSLAWYRSLAYNKATINRSTYPRGYGFAVRCVLTLINLPPDPPYDPVPPDSSVNQQVDLQLSWTCTDPEYDPLTYDVCFGTDNPPPQVSSGQSSTSYDPDTLDFSTTYYWKVVAHDDHNNSTAGPVWTFSTADSPAWICGQPFVDSRDNQTYATIQIGTQCWMAENLNIGTRIDGNNPQSNNGAIEKYCYNNITSICDTYGGLYQWSEMMQYVITPGVQGICPDDWHLPTDAEWCTLEQFIDPTITCYSTGWRGVDGGGKLKESGYDHWVSPNTGATNSSGFTGLPGGYRYVSLFGDITLYGRWWTSTEGDSAKAWFRSLGFSSAQVRRHSFSKQEYGFSVRCISD